jgi:hypothetical protein
VVSGCDIARVPLRTRGHRVAHGPRTEMRFARPYRSVRRRANRSGHAPALRCNRELNGVRSALVASHTDRNRTRRRGSGLELSRRTRPLGGSMGSGAASLRRGSRLRHPAPGLHATRARGRTAAARRVGPERAALAAETSWCTSDTGRSVRKPVGRHLIALAIDSMTWTSHCGSRRSTSGEETSRLRPACTAAGTLPTALGARPQRCRAVCTRPAGSPTARHREPFAAYPRSPRAPVARRAAASFVAPSCARGHPLRRYRRRGATVA